MCSRNQKAQHRLLSASRLYCRPEPRSAAHEISVALGEGQDLAAGGRWHEAEAILKTIDTRLQEYRTLETMPPAIVPIQKLFEERQQQVIHILIPLDLSASMEK